MLSTLFTLLIIIGYLVLTIYVANQEQRTDREPVATRSLLYVGTAIMGLLGVYVLLLAINAQTTRVQAEPGEDVSVLEIGTGEVAAAVLISVLSTVAAYSIISSSSARHQLKGIIGQWGNYDPNSIVHTTAVVLCLLLVSSNTILFLTSGGTSAMAESLDEQGASLIQPVVQAVIQVGAAFLGVGYAVRRMLPQALARLGLQRLTWRDFTRGFFASLALYLLIILFSALLSLLIEVGLIDGESLDEQTRAAESLANAFATPLAAVVLSASAAVGEEIFFRGALQPVFGNLLTSIMFAVLHTQNLLSPGIILLFLVSLGLGTLRNRYNTNVAIVAHFLYNFIQLTLLILAQSAGVV